MRIQLVRISGFRGIPFCAEYVDAPTPIVKWEDCAFQIKFDTNEPFLYAIIGPNSCGKSSILYALQYFFSNTTKLADEGAYHLKNTNNPIIIEVTLKGKISDPAEWLMENCTFIDGEQIVTLVSVTTTTNRQNYVRKPNGVLRKQVPADNKILSLLMPKFRLIPADSKLTDDVNPEKKNLVTDLIDDLISSAPKASNRSVLFKLNKAIGELEQLVSRDENETSSRWKEVVEIEQSISSGLADMTPGRPNVRFKINESIPTLQSIFSKGRFSMVDGVELSFEGHGLGIQRTFLISVLNTWVKLIGHQKDNQDFIFAIEEPELYLHPHAIRSLLSILETISKQDQVVISSHVGEFVNSVPLDNVIKIRRAGNTRSIIQPNLDHLVAAKKTKVQRYLLEERSDMLFARAVLLVEGQSEFLAIPNFARKLNIDLNKRGISIVFTEGNQNFSTYHHILSAFGIPHVILADGDGNKSSKVEKYRDYADHLFVLEEDFEFMIVSSLSEKRLLSIFNRCRKLRGKRQLINLNSSGITAEQLRSGWWEKLMDDFNSDVSKEHRSQYLKQKSEIREILYKMAKNVVENNHLFPSALIKKRAGLLQKEGKPLVGRVLGEMLTSDEISSMAEVCEALERVIVLAG